MGGTSIETPVSSADGHEVHLGVDDAATDGSGNFLGSLDTKADVAIAVANCNVALEAGALTSSGLLLHGHDLHDLVLEGGADELVNDLVFLDGKGEKEDLLDGLDLAILDKAAELGHGDPLFLVLVAVTATATAATTASTAITTATIATSAIYVNREGEKR